MSNYYLLVGESKEAFSMIEHENECDFEILNDGDKIIGYVSSHERSAAYIFYAKSSGSEGRCGLIKAFETISGPSFYEVSVIIQRIIYDHPDVKTLIQIDNSTYREIIEKMLGACFIEYAMQSDFAGVGYDDYLVKQGGENVLLYGVTGSGKSWIIEHEYCNDMCKVERVVFHPDYTNADFIGQILPIVDGEKQVTYEFVPGPFTMMLRNAERDPVTDYVLIIEEINRGNAPAIFGEALQLLDRTLEEKQIEGLFYPNGVSEYGITHRYMAEAIYGDPTHKVRIPRNLWIIATMNTSYQNAFTLDTAFQRRWKMRLVENTFDNVPASLAYAPILDTGVTWRRFCETVNAIIVGNKAKMASPEDKRLGVYFVHETDLEYDENGEPSEGAESLLDEYNTLLRHERYGSITPFEKARVKEIRNAVMKNRVFPEKVIKYLWDDAFKFNPGALFDTDKMDDLEGVIRAFVYNTGRDRLKIFKPSVYDALYEDLE